MIKSAAFLALAAVLSFAGGYMRRPGPVVGVVSLAGMENLGFPGMLQPDLAGRAAGLSGQSPAVAAGASRFLLLLQSGRPKEEIVAGQLEQIRLRCYEEIERAALVRGINDKAATLTEDIRRQLETMRLEGERTILSLSDPVLIDLRLKVLNAEIDLDLAMPENKGALAARLASARSEFAGEMKRRRADLAADIDARKRKLETEARSGLDREAELLTAGLRSERGRTRDSINFPEPAVDMRWLPAGQWRAIEDQLQRRLDRADGEGSDAALAVVKREGRQALHRDRALRAAAASLAGQRRLAVVIAGAVPLDGYVDLTADINEMLKKMEGVTSE